jgi:transmembrane sensor
MKENPAYYSELITKYLANEANDAETRELSAWLKEDPGNLKIFEELRSAWIKVEISKIGTEHVVDEEWNRLRERIEAQKRRSLYTWSMRIAAGLLILAVVTFLLVTNFKKPKEIRLCANDKLIETTLPDGSAITLNSGSTLVFPEHFNGKTREVKLEGEAFFKVRHDEKSRFIITTGKLLIEDIGTSFYVKTDKPGETPEVILTEGQAAVSLLTDPSSRIILNEGEKAGLGADGTTLEKSTNNDPNFLAWKTHRLEFSDNTLGEVVTLLNKVYHTDIRITGSYVGNCRLTAIFDNQSLGSVLNVIQSTLDVTITSKGRAIEISGKGCD